MKQHITDEQCDELSYEELDRLFGELSFMTSHEVTIGKMIEVLDDMCIITRIGRRYDSTSDFVVELEKYVPCDGGEVLENFRYESEELCDALFEAIKAVL